MATQTAPHIAETGISPAPRTFQCHARRHLTAPEFMAYDAIVAMAKSAEGIGELIFYGKVTTVANYIDRSRETANTLMSSLERKGWLVADGEQQRWRGGRFGTRRYVVMEHDEFAEDHSCPPPRYDPQTGAKLGPKKTLASGLADHNAKRRSHRDRKS